MAANGVFSALATVSVLLRIWVRWRKKNEFKADDYTIFIALILTWCSFVLNYYRTKNGLGMHLLNITPDMSRRFGIAYYTNLIFYILSQMFTQLSVLFLYQRVFTLARIWFRNTLAVIAFLAITSNLSAVLACIFACSPIKKGWSLRTTAGHCIDFKQLFVAHAGLSLIVDVAIVVAPLPLIWGLHTSRRTKMGVSGMILLGSLVAIVNPIKIYYFVVPLRGDLTYDGEVAPAIWSHVQLCLGVVGANLPCLKPLFHGIRGVLSTHHPSASATASGNIRSARSGKGPASDQYKSLEGKEPSLTESDIGLVPLHKWTPTPSFPGQSYGVHTQSMVEGGASRSTDMEQGLSVNEIGVTRDIDVSSSRAE